MPTSKKRKNIKKNSAPRRTPAPRYNSLGQTFGQAFDAATVPSSFAAVVLAGKLATNSKNEEEALQDFFTAEWHKKQDREEAQRVERMKEQAREAARRADGFAPYKERTAKVPRRITEAQIEEFGQRCDTHTHVPESMVLSEDGGTLFINPGNEDDDTRQLVDWLWILLDTDWPNFDDEDRDAYHNSPTWAEDWMAQENVEIVGRMRWVKDWMARDYPNHAWAEVELVFEQPFTEVAVERLKELKRAVDGMLTANPGMKAYDAMKQLNPYGAFDE